jgi:hypothetical protein
MPGRRSTCAVPPDVPWRGPFGCYRIAKQRTLREYIRLRAARWEIGAIRGAGDFAPRRLAETTCILRNFFRRRARKARVGPHFTARIFPKKRRSAAIANGVSGLVRELSAPRQPRPDGSLSSDDWRLRIWPEITSRFQCIRHTPCADGSRHTECAGYILLWV